MADNDLDRRLREGLRAEAEVAKVAAMDRLPAVHSSGRRRLLRHRVSLGATVVLAAAVAVGGGVFVLDLRDSSAPPPVAPVPTGLTGLYSRDVTAAQAAGTSVVAGHWSLEFSSDGSVRVVAPSGYHGVLSGTTFESSAESMRTSLFVQDLCAGQPIGSFAWSRSSGLLRFTEAGDACEARRTLLIGGAWRVGP